MGFKRRNHGHCCQEYPSSTSICQTRAYIERLDVVVLFFSDQEITWSGVVYLYLLGTDHPISDVRLLAPWDLTVYAEPRMGHMAMQG